MSIILKFDDLIILVKPWFEHIMYTWHSFWEFNIWKHFVYHQRNRKVKVYFPSSFSTNRKGWLKILTNSKLSNNFDKCLRYLAVVAGKGHTWQGLSQYIYFPILLINTLPHSPEKQTFSVFWVNKNIILQSGECFKYETNCCRHSFWVISRTFRTLTDGQIK